MEECAVWRIQLKPDKKNEVSYRDLVDFCIKKGIIGVGWIAIKNRDDSWDAIKKECEQYDNKSAAFKAIHAISQVKKGDLIWTRLGEDASEYYLCRVGEKTWRDCSITEEEQEKYDLGNIVSAQWIRIGKQNLVPGKVVNSFSPRATIQHVYDVSAISMAIWNKYSDNNAPKYSTRELSMNDFWNAIGSEELENLVILYIQSKGYFVYTSTIKIDNPKYECVLVSSDGSHYAFPQVKRNTKLSPKYYAEGIGKDDKVFLYSSSERYGEAVENVICITRKELEVFMKKNKAVLPSYVKLLLDSIGKR